MFRSHACCPSEEFPLPTLGKFLDQTELQTRRLQTRSKEADPPTILCFIRIHLNSHEFFAIPSKVNTPPIKATVTL